MATKLSEVKRKVNTSAPAPAGIPNAPITIGFDTDMGNGVTDLIEGATVFNPSNGVWVIVFTDNLFGQTSDKRKSFLANSHSFKALPGVTESEWTYPPRINLVATGKRA